MNEGEFDRLTNEQIDDLLRQHGYDPAKVETTGRVFAEMCLENVRLHRQVAQLEADNEKLDAAMWRMQKERDELPSAPLDVALSFVEDALAGKEPAGERGNGLAGLADVRRHVAELRRQLAEAQAQNERLAADLRWHEIWIAEHQERIERLTAERDDLRQQLEEARS